MTVMSRRSVLRASLGAAAAWTLARPYIAHAAATTATVWWVQGFAEEEDVSFKKIVADYEKASGNTIDYSIIPYAPERQKIISAMTSGAAPTCSRTIHSKSLRYSPGMTSSSTLAMS
jgi:multiple sugar transport system substrate-binding protein